MKAVNLIPVESASSGGRSPVGVYALLGALALLVAMSGTYALTNRSVDTKRGELAAVAARAQATETKAAAFKRYADFSTLRQARVETVKKIAGTRFDWAQALHEVAHTLPAGSWATSLRATVDPSAAVGGTADQLRGAIPVPAVELAGCASSQEGVAATVSSLRSIAGVQRVTLSSSQKQDDSSAGAGADSAGSTTGCGSHPQFSLTVFFKAPAGASASASGAAASTTASTTASGGTTP
jgi:Tfp pilus assembly protein PilN